MKEKVFNITISALIGAIFFGFIFSSLIGALIGSIASVISFLRFVREAEEDRKKIVLENAESERQNAIYMKKFRTQELKERKEYRAWLKELRELHPH